MLLKNDHGGVKHMSKVYRLKPLEYSVEVPQLSLIEFADIIGDEDFSIIRRQPRTNEKLSDRWTPVSCALAPQYKNVRHVPDVSFWGSYLLLSKRAYKALSPVLANEGEFLPLHVANLPMYLFVSLQFAKEDLAKTHHRYEEGIECGLSELVFKRRDIANKAVFKSLLYGCHALFATGKFKSAFEEHDFTGITFDEDLAGIF